MDIYKLNNENLESIDRISFDSEKEIQSIVEHNTELLFDLEFIGSEVSHGKFKFDTLCWKDENKSFVIIEYKKSKSSSMIEQGFAYLSAMLNHQSDFVLEYNENMDKNLKRHDVDWSQCKVIFISPDFAKYQKDSVNFKDISFELWEIQKFSNGYFGFQKIEPDSKESITSLVKDKGSVVSKVSKEIKKYDEKTIVSKYNDKFLALYHKLKDKIFAWGNLSINLTKDYVSFKKNKTILLYVYPRKKYLLLEFLLRVDFAKNVKDRPIPFNFKDPDKQFELYKDDSRELYQHKFTSKSDLDYIVYCLKQKYDSIK